MQKLKIDMKIVKFTHVGKVKEIDKTNTSTVYIFIIPMFNWFYRNV